MKGKDFAQLLTEFSDVLNDERAAAFRAFSPVFEAAPNRNVVAICGVLSGIQPPEHGNGLRLQEMIGLLSALKRLLGRGAAKKAVIDDLETVATTLAPFGQFPTATFADAAIERLHEETATSRRPSSAVRDDVVQNYLRRLEDALGDESRFAEAFQALKNDKLVTATEAKKLSKAFAKETAKSKSAAFDLIWARHAALMGSRARQLANTGRTAA